MKNTLTDSSDDGISGIMLRRVMKAWGEGKNARQISTETGLPIAVVYRYLKLGQKPIVKKKLKNDSRQDNF
jgi:hypothetical protein